MSQNGDHGDRLLTKGKESAPPNFLSHLERATHEAYRARARARRRRWLGGACLSLAALVPLAWLLESPEAPSITAEQIRATTERTPAVNVTPRTRSPEPKTAPAPVEPPDPAPVKRAPAPSAKPRPPALGEELAILARVRQALANDDAPRALSVLEEHGKDLKAGQLRLEAEVLRLEALSKLGAKQEVSRRARSFIDQNPNSPLVDRVRGFVDE